MSNGITAWSLYRVTEHEQCNHRSKLKIVLRVDKDDEPVTVEALERGLAIHQEFENFLLGKTEDLDFPFFLERAIELRDAPNNFIEENWGFTEDWGATGYFDDDVWLRLSIDAGFIDGEIAEIDDWKTGKVNPVKYRQQGQLYALGVFHRFPEVNTVLVRFNYVDHDQVDKQTYKREHMKVFQPVWERRAQALLTDTEFRPSPSKWNCRYCSVNHHCNYAHEE